MAKTSSAKKAERASKRKRVFNGRRKKAMRDSVKAVGKLIVQKSAEAAGSLPKMYQAIDKAAKRGTINKNAASRMKSRITKRVAAIAK